MNTEICKYKNKIPEYCEGLLDELSAAEMHSHIAECEQCKREEAEYRSFGELIKSAAEPVPEELHGRIMSAVRMEKRRERFARAIKRFALPACAALLVLVAAPAVIRGGQNNDAPSEVYSGARYDGAQIPTEDASALNSDSDKDVVINTEQSTAADAIAPSYAVERYLYEAKEDENGEGESFAVECPVVRIERNVLETLKMSFAESVILTDGDGVLFKLSDALRLALVSNGAVIDAESEYVKVNEK